MQQTHETYFKPQALVAAVPLPVTSSAAQSGRKSPRGVNHPSQAALMTQVVRRVYGGIKGHQWGILTPRDIFFSVMNFVGMRRRLLSEGWSIVVIIIIFFMLSFVIFVCIYYLLLRPPVLIHVISYCPFFYLLRLLHDSHSETFSLATTCRITSDQIGNRTSPQRSSNVQVLLWDLY